MNTTFAGEMQLAGWSESHTSGCKVTFWLSSPDDLEAFRALTVRKGNTAGHRFMAALVEIGEDELPVPQPTPEKPKGGELARLAGIWCNDPRFWDWITDRDELAVSNEAEAAEWIREICQVNSRIGIDHSALAAKTFHARIREPFSEYLKQQETPAKLPRN